MLHSTSPNWKNPSGSQIRRDIQSFLMVLSLHQSLFQVKCGMHVKGNLLDKIHILHIFVLPIRSQLFLKTAQALKKTTQIFSGYTLMFYGVSKASHFNDLLIVKSQSTNTAPLHCNPSGGQLVLPLYNRCWKRQVFYCILNIQELLATSLLVVQEVLFILLLCQIQGQRYKFE